jgi:hypothetical protein
VGGPLSFLLLSITGRGLDNGDGEPAEPVAFPAEGDLIAAAARARADLGELGVLGRAQGQVQRGQVVAELASGAGPITGTRAVAGRRARSASQATATPGRVPRGPGHSPARAALTAAQMEQATARLNRIAVVTS